MSVKSVSVKKKATKPEFPCLRYDKFGRIVFFKKNGKGVVVHDPTNGAQPHILADYIECWDMKCFTPYAGKITLSNED